MKTNFLLIFAFFLLFSANAQTNKKVAMTGKTTQVSEWDKVQAFENQSLPKSALEVVNGIYQKALQEKNSPELIKSMIYKLKFETSIDRDRLPQLIGEMETFAAADNNKTEQAVLYSILAELYSKYYQNDSYKINQRTALPEADAGTDLETWPANLFIQRIAGYVKRSLEPVEWLQKTNVLEYRDILLESESSQTLRPTLYDFLIYRGIDLLNSFANIPFSSGNYDFTPQILQLYQELLTFRSQENNPLALLMAELDRLDFVLNHATGDDMDKGEKYLAALEQLEKQYAANDFCAEILYKKALYYNNRKIFPRDLDYENIRLKQKESLKQVYEICSEGIRKYPDYKRIGLLKNLLTQITQSELTVNSDNSVYPGKELKLQINYRNLDKLTLEIYKINVPVSVYLNNWERKGQYNKNGKLIKTQQISLVNDTVYNHSDTTIKVPMEALGNYEYVIYPDRDTKLLANQQFSVSRLATVGRAVEGKREFLVTDLLSGKPVEGASIHLYKRSNNRLVKTQTLRTDINGLALGGKEKEFSGYNATYQSDTSLLVSNVPWLSQYTESESLQSLNLFTDRSIYRPGQTVYFKGITYNLKEMQVLPNRQFTVTLYNANLDEVSQKQVTTNEWGSFTGEFVLPQGTLNGQFSITIDNIDYTYFQVEEYKRPTFDIQFDKNEDSYRFGDKVTVKGNAKTFSGVSIRNAKAKYRITSSYHWFYRMYRQPVQVAAGDVEIDEQGKFEIHFTPEKTFADKDRKNVNYTYTILIDITDTKGETQNSETQINIGDTPFILSIKGLPEAINKDSLSTIKIGALNLNSNPVAVSGIYKVYSLKPKEAGKLDNEKDDWLQDKLLIENSFESNKEINLSLLKSLAPGKYRILATAKDAEEYSTDFTLFTNEDKRPPVPVYQWLIPVKTTCAIGEKAQIIYGSSAKDVYVLCEIFKGTKKLSVSRFVLNNENRKIEIPFMEFYGDGVEIFFTFIKDGKVFSKNETVLRKQPSQKLDLKMDVFRDRLLPGQKEEWKISVKDVAEKGVFSELLAVMYDASLDRIDRHGWTFRPVREFHFSAPNMEKGKEFSTSSQNLRADSKYIEVPDFTVARFNWFGWSFNSQTMIRGLRKSMPMMAEDATMVRESEAVFSANGVTPPPMLKATVQFTPPVVAGDKDITDGGMISEVEMTDSQKIREVAPVVQIRQNFNETAFFYPQLKTNEAGETLISFTVPESNTTWKFMGLAHTKDLKFGQIVKEAISQKKLMVAPNIPRFIRESDKATISANISNLSESALSGTVSIGFFDPSTERTTIAVPEAEKPFTVEAGNTVAVSWTFAVPAGIDLTTVKIVAATSSLEEGQRGVFSDGEQHLIPVLPNRMLVTESLPLDILGGETKTFTFDRMKKNSSTLQSHSLTLEFTNNPVWYAVQALPSLTAPQSDDVLSWFGAYYANTVAVRIAKSTPKIKQIIDNWNKQGGTKETLLSNLEKNQELKAVLLEETPWVMEAKNETEMKQKLSLLFDLNRTDYLNSQAFMKLFSLQAEDGGWSWFKGMHSNVSITQWILYGLKEIEALNSAGGGAMQENAIHFIDQKFKQHYDDYLKSLKSLKSLESQKEPPTTYELEYLLVRALYQDLPLKETGEAVKFYTSIAEKNWASIPDLYGRAIAALFLQRTGKTDIAQSIVKSLREHASHKPDLGMYWANSRAYSFFFNNAIANQSFIMKAFYETGASPREMDEMKLWLLKQKQTQEWESLPGMISTIQILLQTGSNWLEDVGKTSIQLGNKSFDTSKGDAGTGYIKEVFDAGNITPDMSKVKIMQENTVPGWGALYWQYFEDLDKIIAAKTGLNVEKSLFVEKTTATGKNLLPVTEATPLKIGDKAVVRLVVRADRDFEYVLLKDMRASCFEPVEQLSGIRWAQATVYYQSPKDASMNYYLYNLPKGTYVFEYPLYVTSEGNYSNGITTIQCLYAPEFVSHTSGGRVSVVK